MCCLVRLSPGCYDKGTFWSCAGSVCSASSAERAVNPPDMQYFSPTWCCALLKMFIVSKQYFSQISQISEKSLHQKLVCTQDLPIIMPLAKTPYLAVQMLFLVYFFLKQVLREQFKCRKGISACIRIFWINSLVTEERWDFPQIVLRGQKHSTQEEK